MSKGRGASSVKNRGNRIFIECLQKCPSASPCNWRKQTPARAKTTSAKAFAPRQGPAHLRRALRIETPEIHTYVKFICEDDIKIKNKYFATV
jgi:hypothetical protein